MEFVCGPLSLFVLVGVAVVHGLALRHRRQMVKHLSELVEFATTLEEGAVEGTPSFWWGFRGVSVRGARHGYRRRLFFTRQRDCLLYELELPDASAELSFEITPATRLSRLTRTYRGAAPQTGDPTLDRDFDFEADDPGSLARLTQVEHLHDALTHLFTDAGLDSVRLVQGHLIAAQAIRLGHDALLIPARLELVFSVLEGLAQACARVQVTLQERSVYGWTGGAESVRCPFCRDDLGDALEACEACPHCATLHHAECLAEAGGCTIFGCQGAPAQVPA